MGDNASDDGLLGMVGCVLIFPIGDSADKTWRVSNFRSDGLLMFGTGNGESCGETWERSFFVRMVSC